MVDVQRMFALLIVTVQNINVSRPKQRDLIDQILTLLQF